MVLKSGAVYPFVDQAQLNVVIERLNATRCADTGLFWAVLTAEAGALVLVGLIVFALLDFV
jgi:hypothetical protein